MIISFHQQLGTTGFVVFCFFCNQVYAISNETLDTFIFGIIFPLVKYLTTVLLSLVWILFHFFLCILPHKIQAPFNMPCLSVLTRTMQRMVSMPAVLAVISSSRGKGSLVRFHCGVIFTQGSIMLYCGLCPVTELFQRSLIFCGLLCLGNH